MSKNVFVRTFGCQMNEYDSDKMIAVLRNRLACEKASDLHQADILLVNTCSIREKAEEKLYSLLGEWRLLKQEKPELIIGVGGCVGSQEGEQILKRAPYVDLIFGPQTLHRLPEMVQEVMQARRPVVDISFPEIEKFDHLPEPRAEGPSAFVSIMEGCSKYCSYCIVPYTRGEEISRPFDDVLTEVASLVDQGVREVTLLGQNVNDYRGVKHQGGTADLALLIHYIAALDGIARIRFTTSHPLAFSDDLIAAYAEVPKLANHLHLPVQSGSNRILGMMKRGYTVERFRERIASLRKVRPEISISSDFIIGFPTETDDDFEQTMQLVRDIGFDNSFSFIYSKRPGTPAALLVDDISPEVKKERLAIIQKLLVSQAEVISQNMIGTRQKVVITGLSRKSSAEYAGRTDNNRVVNFIVNPARFHSLQLIGKMAEVTITEANPYNLRGELAAVLG